MIWRKKKKTSVSSVDFFDSTLLIVGIWTLIGYRGIQRSMRQYLASYWLQVDKLTPVTQVDEEIVRSGQEASGTRTGSVQN